MAVEISNDAYNAVVKYFSVLSHSGYKPYSSVNNLLVYTFAEELLTGDLSYFITEKDYNTIDKALNCLYGSCMISYPDYKRAVDKVQKKTLEEYRITETGTLRETELDNLRVMS